MSQIRSRKSVPASVVLACVTVAMTAATSPVLADLRVNPYLQNPSGDGMLFTWFSGTEGAGSIEITGPGLTAPVTRTTPGDFQPILRYTDRERTQTLPGLTQGSWLLGDSNYKHQADVRGLSPDTTYAYTVTQGATTFTDTFRTAPTRANWSSVRFVAMADSETDVAGRLAGREWQPGALAPGSQSRPALSGSAWATKFGTQGSGTGQTLRYSMTEQVGYANNLRVVNERDPDFVVMPGDLVQGGGYQVGWDEFFRHNAGEFDNVLTKRPIVPALGNWENFGALNGGYGTFNDSRFGDNQFGPKFGRDKYKAYFDAPSNGTPQHQDNYYRLDYGPVTVITLDSSNGEPDDRPQNYGGAGQPPKVTGRDFTGPGTDTQNNFTRTQYESFGGTDLSDFNPGSTQWNWARAELASAREAGQIVFVQFHHAPYSNGEHGQPMNHAQTTGQGGTPMRQYHPMFEEFGVAAVLSGHSEMFERSFVDEDGDGVGVHYYDVGVAGDGLRGQKRDGGSGFDLPLLGYNAFSRWTADQDAAENWQLVDGVLQLIDGGKHYGHLEVNVERLVPAEDDAGSPPATGEDDLFARITFTPVYVFPVLDAEYNLLRTERRVYGDETVLFVNAAGQVIPEPTGLAMLAVGAAGLLKRRPRR